MLTHSNPSYPPERVDQIQVKESGVLQVSYSLHSRTKDKNDENPVKSTINYHEVLGVSFIPQSAALQRGQEQEYIQAWVHYTALCNVLLGAELLCKYFA